MKVLIAEDDLTSRTILEVTLRKWGYETISCSDGEAAWAVLQSADSPQLVILDWMMPGMDGIEVCRRARELTGRISLHIILLTALNRKQDIVAGLGAGADDYLSKPFDSSELRARIQAGQRIIQLQTAMAERVRELEDALAHVKTLQGVLPICMHCHKIRTDRQSWQRIESYLEEHSQAQFSHALCEECLEEHYPKPPEDAGLPEVSQEDERPL